MRLVPFVVESVDRTQKAWCRDLQGERFWLESMESTWSVQWNMTVRKKKRESEETLGLSQSWVCRGEETQIWRLKWKKPLKKDIEHARETVGGIAKWLTTLFIQWKTPVNPGGNSIINGKVLSIKKKVLLFVEALNLSLTWKKKALLSSVVLFFFFFLNRLFFFPKWEHSSGVWTFYIYSPSHLHGLAREKLSKCFLNDLIVVLRLCIGFPFGTWYIVSPEGMSSSLKL